MTSTASDLQAAVPVPTHLRHRDEGFVIDSRPASPLAHLRAVWRVRGLVYVLARKEFFVRYRRSVLGTLWVLILPILQATVLIVVFSKLGRFTAGVPHFPVYVFSGFIAWVYFASTFTGTATSIVDGSQLASRIYFPRAVLPLVRLATDAFGLVVTAAVLVGLAAVFGAPITLNLLLLVPALLLLLGFSAAVGMVLSVVHVYFRDTRFLTTAVVMPWFYITPIFYSPTQIEGSLRRFIVYNPMTGVVDVFRAATVGAGPEWRRSVLVACVVTAVLMAVALELQRRFDRNLNDLL